MATPESAVVPFPTPGLSPETKAALDSAGVSTPSPQPVQAPPAPTMDIFCVVALVKEINLKEKPDDPDDKGKMITLAGNGAVGMFPVFSDYRAALAFSGNNPSTIITLPLSLMPAPATPTEDPNKKS